MKPRTFRIITGGSKTAAATAAGLGVVVIAFIDYLTGTDLRVYPLYYAPVALIGWWFGRNQAIAASLLCAAAWFISNSLAGMATGAWVSAANFVVQMLSFSIMGVLVASLKTMIEHEQTLSRTDALTVLLNARGFAERTGVIVDLASRYRHPLTLAYIDLDNFKAVNDRGGHSAGDALLRATADCIRLCTRRGDFAARLGGDEFALLLPETDREAALVLLERLRKRAESALRSQVAPVTMSIGAVTYAEAPGDVEALLSSADAAMYEAKRGGKNRIHINVVGTAG